MHVRGDALVHPKEVESEAIRQGRRGLRTHAGRSCEDLAGHGSVHSPAHRVRFVAAFWVVLYHYQPALATAGVLVPASSIEVLRVGSLGVDLFFTFVGIHPHPHLPDEARPEGAGEVCRTLPVASARTHLPVHFVMLNVAGLAVLAASLAGSGDARARDWLNPISYIKQPSSFRSGVRTRAAAGTSSPGHCQWNGSPTSSSHSLRSSCGESRIG